MHMYVAISICILFVCLMTVVIVNETMSVVEVLSTLVSSVDIVSLKGPHRYSMIGLSARFLNETPFAVGDYCQCNLENSEQEVLCNTTTIEYNAAEEDEEDDVHILLLTAGPTDWEKREATVFHCNMEFIPLITYLVIPESYEKFEQDVRKSNGEVRAQEFLDDDLFHSPSPWINSETINQVLLSREDHYLRHELEKSYIKTIVSQASHNQEGYTQVTFSWREGQVTEIDKFSNGSYWSLATLMCTVLLGVERCIAFINRAKNRTPAQKAPKVTQVAEANPDSPSPPPEKGGDMDHSRLWSAKSTNKEQLAM